MYDNNIYLRIIVGKQSYVNFEFLANLARSDVITMRFE